MRKRIFYTLDNLDEMKEPIAGVIKHDHIYLEVPSELEGDELNDYVCKAIEDRTGCLVESWNAYKQCLTVEQQTKLVKDLRDTNLIYDYTRRTMDYMSDDMCALADDLLEDIPIDFEIDSDEYNDAHDDLWSEISDICWEEKDRNPHIDKKVQVRDEVITSLFELISGTTDEKDFRDFVKGEKISDEAKTYIANLIY